MEHKTDIQGMIPAIRSWESHRGQVEVARTPRDSKNTPREAKNSPRTTPRDEKTPRGGLSSPRQRVAPVDSRGSPSSSVSRHKSNAIRITTNPSATASAEESLKAVIWGTLELNLDSDINGKIPSSGRRSRNYNDNSNDDAFKCNADLSEEDLFSYYDPNNPERVCGSPLYRTSSACGNRCEENIKDKSPDPRSSSGFGGFIDRQISSSDSGAVFILESESDIDRDGRSWRNRSTSSNSQSNDKGRVSNSDRTKDKDKDKVQRMTSPRQRGKSTEYIYSPGSPTSSRNNVWWNSSPQPSHFDEFEKIESQIVSLVSSLPKFNESTGGASYMQSSQMSGGRPTNPLATRCSVGDDSPPPLLPSNIGGVSPSRDLSSSGLKKFASAYPVNAAKPGVTRPIGVICNTGYIGASFQSCSSLDKGINLPSHTYFSGVKLMPTSPNMSSLSGSDHSFSLCASESSAFERTSTASSISSTATCDLVESRWMRRNSDDIKSGSKNKISKLSSDKKRTGSSTINSTSGRSAHRTVNMKKA